MKKTVLLFVMLTCFCFFIVNCQPGVIKKKSYPDESEISAKIIFDVYDENDNVLSYEQLKDYPKSLIVVVQLSYDVEHDPYDTKFFSNQNNYYAQLLGINRKSNFLISSSDPTIWYTYNCIVPEVIEELMEFAKKDYVAFILISNNEVSGDSV